jgi:chorismate dehydratase
MAVPRITSSSYSNTAPLIWSFLYGSERGKYELILDTAPARSAELLQQKRVDAAFVPAIAFQIIDDLLIVPDVCVGAKKRVESVCLVTKGLDLCDVKTVSLDVSSKTSVALTKIIFREFLGFDPIWINAEPNVEKMLEKSDCALIIGDPALLINKGRRTNDKGLFRKFDLAELWKSYTEYGFVFAMWMANNDRKDVAKEIDFAKARDEGLTHLDEIIANYENEIPLTREQFRNYLTENISFEIDESMLKGLNLYFKLAHKHGFIAQNKELAYIK